IRPLPLSAPTRASGRGNRPRDTPPQPFSCWHTACTVRHRTNRERGRPATMTTKPAGHLSRRRLLRTTGIAAAGTLADFPTIWAQNIKNVTLRQFGTGVSNLNAIADKVKEDLGFTLQMTALDTDAVTQKAVTQPKSYDVADIEYFITKKVFPTGVLQPM